MGDLTVLQHPSYRHTCLGRRHLILVTGYDQRRRQIRVLVLGRKAIAGGKILEVNVVGHSL